MTEAQWPPASGVPAKSRFKNAKTLEWGESPFDTLDRAELLRLVQAYHSMLVAAQSVMRMQAEAMPSRYWTEGPGGRALGKAEALMKLSGQCDGDPASERIYSSFFRAADVLLFPHLRNDEFSDWGVDARGEMIAPHSSKEGYRPIEWRDVLPVSHDKRSKT